MSLFVHSLRSWRGCLLTLDSTAHDWGARSGFWDGSCPWRRICRRHLKLAPLNCAYIGFWLLGSLKAFDLLTIFPAFIIGVATHVGAIVETLDKMYRALIQTMKGPVWNTSLAFLLIFYDRMSRQHVNQACIHQKHRHTAASDQASAHHYAPSSLALGLLRSSFLWKNTRGHLDSCGFVSGVWGCLIFF
jgi:hypothetical protein